jgi:hypothetical protein
MWEHGEAVLADRVTHRSRNVVRLDYCSGAYHRLTRHALETSLPAAVEHLGTHPHRTDAADANPSIAVGDR